MTIPLRCHIVEHLYFIVLLFGLSPLLMAQSMGSIQGTVSDPSGAVVAGARVSVHPAQNGAAATSTALSDANGAYRLHDLKAGNYVLEVYAPGFKAAAVANVAVADGSAATVDVRLIVAAAVTNITVTDTSNPEGSYKVATVDFGPLGNVSELDTPYTVITVPTNLMENEEVRKFSDVLKYLPGAQMEPRSGMDVGRPQTRGFEGTVTQNAHIDGLNIGATTEYPMEQFDRIEVQNGLVGSEYGAATPSGNFNFVLKRPTNDTTAKISLDLDSPTTTTVNGDAGGLVTKYFGYRVDALHTNGTGYVDESHHRRELISATTDIHPWSRGVLQLNGSQFTAHDYGFPGNFAYGGSKNTIFPSAPTVTLRGLGQSWAGVDMSTRTMSARFLNTFNDNWNLTLGGLHQSVNRLMLTLTNTITDNAGDFTQASATGQNGVFFINSTLGYLKGSFKTYGLTHEVSIGTNGDVLQVVGANSTPLITVYENGTKVTGSVTSNLYTPVITDATITGKFGTFIKSSTATDENFVASDTIKFARRWMLQFIGAEVWLRTYNFASGVISTTYDTNGFAPSASISYKPAQNMSTYFTYASSLYNGDSYTNSSSTTNGVKTVTIYTDPGYLPPYRSKQYEAGYKWDYRGAELTISAYRMTRPLPYVKEDSSVTNGTTVTNTYTASIEGTQQNDGMDFMIAGKVIKSLNVFGGFTWLNPELIGTNSTTTSGKQVTGAPRIQSSFLLEYEVPHVKGLAVNGNWHHTGIKAANDTNSMWAPNYDTFDLGARYEEHTRRGDISYRFSVANIGNVNYWYGIFPSGAGLYGESNTGNSAFLGTPRIASASVQYRFTKKK